MKLGFIVIVVLVLSTIASNLLLQDPGYVVISIRGYLIEMSVPTLIAGLLLLVLSIWLVIKLFRAPRKLGEAASRYRSGRAGQRLTRGVIEIAEGNFAKGEKLLTGSARDSDAPLLNYLQAARAAHLLGQDERRDEWLREAYEQAPEAANAVLLTQAELQLDRQQYEPALATLRKIEENTPNHSHALVLLGRLYFRLNDWHHLASILDKLKKHSHIEAATLNKWSLRVHQENLQAAADGDAVRLAWKNAPKNLRKSLDLLEAYYAGLIRTGMQAAAEKEIAADLRREWRPTLVCLFGKIESDDPAKQLKKAESWLANHAEDADLLLTVARLCLRNELWGKARSYLETVIALRPTPDAYQVYGKLLNQLGEGDAAAVAYRSGLDLVTQTPLPAIEYLQPDPGND